MGAQYEPGTVAVATVRGVKGVRVLRYGQIGGCPGWVSGPYVKGFMHHADSHLTDVRPLVVLDLTDPQSTLHVLGECSIEYDNDAKPMSRDLVDALRDQIRAQTRPPKPNEPTGLGAVVRDRKGKVYIRLTEREKFGHPEWVAQDLPREWRYYTGIDAVEVLSDGVTS